MARIMVECWRANPHGRPNALHMRKTLERYLLQGKGKGEDSGDSSIASTIETASTGLSGNTTTGLS